MKTAHTIAAQQEAQGSVTAQKVDRRGKHPNSIANLRPWPKGKSANPGGRIKDKAQEIAQSVLEEYYEEIYQGLAQKAAAGDAYAFQVLADRGYGKVKDRVALEDNEGGPAKLVVEFVKPDGSS